jgi:hypothetical protein
MAALADELGGLVGALHVKLRMSKISVETVDNKRVLSSTTGPAKTGYDLE